MLLSPSLPWTKFPPTAPLLQLLMVTTIQMHNSQLHADSLNMQELESITDQRLSILVGGSKLHAQAWLHAVEMACNVSRIAKGLYHLVAWRHMGKAMQERTSSEIPLGSRWNWEAFSTAVVKVVEFVKLPANFPTSAARFAGAVFLAAGLSIAAPAAAVTMLGALGFSSGGVVGGSVAAMIQSMYYGGAVGAGTWFAVAQSVGATGLGLSAGTSIVAGAATGAGAGLLALTSSEDSPSPPTKEASGDNPSLPPTEESRSDSSSSPPYNEMGGNIPGSQSAEETSGDSPSPPPTEESRSASPSLPPYEEATGDS